MVNGPEQDRRVRVSACNSVHTFYICLYIINIVGILMVLVLNKVLFGNEPLVSNS